MELRNSIFRQAVPILALSGLLFLSLTNPAYALPQNPPYKIATFVCEVTPPMGHPLQGGLNVQPVRTVADPLYAHGFVFFGAGDPVVLVSVDWCGIGNDAHDLWRTELARAAKTRFERVMVCAIHQHDAPLADLEAERILTTHKLGKTTLDPTWHGQAVARVAQTIAAAITQARPITHIGVGKAKVDRVASNRRVFAPEKKTVIFRGSATTDQALKEAPEGLIDPTLKTLGFWDGDRAIASISVYATHPMSFYGRGEVSSDFVGLARRLRQTEEPGVHHFYASGCGGNLSAGKYNDGSPQSRVELTRRLHQGWKSAWQSSKKHPLRQVEFRSIPFRLEPKDTPGFRLEDLNRLVASEQSPLSERVRASFALSWRKRCEGGKPNLDLPVLDFGAAQLLLLPGEPFVEYQLFAQRQRPDSLVLTLGYGDYGPCYIPYDKAFAEGGYEPGPWSFVDVGVEKQLKEAIVRGLQGGK